MKRKISILLTVLLLAVLMGYTGYQVIENLTRQIRTVDALEVTVEDKISATGWFIRGQTVVEGETGFSAEYLVSDGEKVSKGQNIAVFFNDDGARRTYDSVRVLQDRLSAMEYAYSMLTSGTDSAKLDQLIFDDMTAIAAALAQGDPSRIGGDYAAVQQLIVSRSGSEADREVFESRISELKGRIDEEQKQVLSGSSRLKAPTSGYFVSGTDGYETVLTPDMLDGITPDMLEQLAPVAEGEGVGTVTTGFCWYYAAALTAEQATVLQQRGTARVSFPELGGGEITADIVRLQTCDDGRAVLVLKSDRMNPEYLTARRQDIDIITHVYTGLKVPARALRQNDGRWGVYVLDGSVVVFKPVSWVYQTESYYLVPTAESAKAGLYRYDRIIVQGSGLEENQVVHRK
ncbi:MAG: hypothetical protein IJT76_02255 [Clostridia bacterium]|nr:hypothetical protein [Clostridia bacterium]